MRGKTWLRALVLLCMIMMVLTGCNSSEISWDSYEGAANEKTFPVPNVASKTDRPTGNSELNYVRYSLPGLKEKEGIPDVYLQTINEWGWQENEDEQSDASRVFIKDNRVVQITIHDDFFMIMVPKNADKSVIRSLENK
ncbi:hypothetical protein J2T13_004191 [Paenibacillus sp. DS2015]|uniref:hypothetical protein n=1 Tax=Paenibacillus sp. DS2015 TaxID=3373917 RepID=UPI003D1E60D1